jgi:hypothetical protein
LSEAGEKGIPFHVDWKVGTQMKNDTLFYGELLRQHSLKKCVLIIWVFGLFTFIGGTFPQLSYAYMEAVPDELKKKPEEEQTRWLNSYFEEAYTLQQKVAKERHERREQMATQFVQTMAEQAFERQTLIAEAEEETRKELEESATRSNAAVGAALFLAGLAALLAWWFYGRRVAVR